MSVIRFPLAAPLGEREPGDSSDPRLKNCFKETILEDGAQDAKPTVYVTKRWGLKAAVDTSSATAGRGIHTWKGAVYAVVGNQLFKDGVDATSAGVRTLDTSTGRVFFAEADEATDLLVFHDKANLYTYDGTTLLKEADVDIPGSMVSGIAILDKYCVLMDSAAVIYNSNVGAVQDWTNGDLLTAEVQADPGVAVSRYINYIVGFGDDTIEYFYDAANTNGSPFNRFDGMGTLIGCAAGDTVALCDQKLLFVARSPGGGRFVGMMEGGFETKRISTQAIDEILDKEKANITNAYAYHIRQGGKDLYVLTLPTTAARTFVADLDENTWYEWSSDVSDTETYFTGVDATNDDGTTYILDENNGRYYELDPETFQDNTGSAESIKVEIVTKKFDMGTLQNKFLWRLGAVGDETASTALLTIQWTDDDYATYSTARTVDVVNSQAWLTRCGMFKRRAFRLQFTANTALRLEALEGNGDTGHYARSG